MSAIHIDDLIRGDQRALQAFYKQYAPVLIFFAVQKITDRHEAEDIVIQLFDVYLKNRQNFDSIVKIKSFLRIAVHNKCLNFLARKKRKIELTQNYARTLEQPNLEEEYDRMEITFELARKIRSLSKILSPRCKQVFELTYIQRLSTREIATELNISESAVTSHRSRAILLIKTHVLALRNKDIHQK